MKPHSNKTKPLHNEIHPNKTEIFSWFRGFAMQQKDQKNQDILISFLENLNSSEIDSKFISNKIDESCFSKEQWANAILTFSNHECSPKATSNPAQLLSYLSCCAESTEGSPIIPDFSHIVLEMLNEFGLDEQSTT